MILTNEQTQYLQDILKQPIKSINKIPTGKFNTSFYLTMENGKVYVLRIAPDRSTPVLFYERNMMLQEPEIHRVVKGKTSIPIAEVVHFEGNFDNVFGRPFIIFTALPGEPCYARPANMKKIKYQLGKHLNELHTKCQKEQFGYVGPHRPMEPQSNWKDGFVTMWAKLLDDIHSIEMYSEKEIDEYKKLLEKYIKHFEYPHPASLCHMDIWTQNILTDGENITGIVDWDRSLYGDVEIEFSVVEYCGLLDENFWAGYGNKPKYNTSFYIKRAFYILYEHQKYIFIRAARNSNIPLANQYRDECRYLLKQISRGKFEIL